MKRVQSQIFGWTTRDAGNDSPVPSPPTSSGAQPNALRHTVGQSMPRVKSEENFANVGGGWSPLSALKSKPKPLEHTTGRQRMDSGFGRTQSEAHFASSPMAAASPKAKPTRVNMLCVFDMDNTMVGDLKSLSDRDNIETNVPWTYWPQGRSRGLSAEFIYKFLQRGMMRPGMINLIHYLKCELGATIVVYTHSEEKWAKKVCDAMEMMVGYKFITRLFHRMDCKDGHREFKAKKSLEFVIHKLQKEDGLTWANAKNTILFEDDGNAVNKAELGRLVKVPSYDYWEETPWNEVVNEDMMAKNPPLLGETVRESVVDWGLVPPSYGKRTLTMEDQKKDQRWAEKKQKQAGIMSAFNNVAKLDRVMYDVMEAIKRDPSDPVTLPERIKSHLKSTKPFSKRQNLI